MNKITKRIMLITLIVSVLLLSLAAFTGNFGVTNFGSIHLSDTNGTATPIFMVDQKGSGVVMELRDSATPVFQIANGGNLNFYQGNLSLGAGDASDASLIYDGNAQDFNISLDDSADDLVIGLGSVAGTTNAIAIDENLDITLCDATASDCDMTFDGIAQDYYIALDDSADDLLIGLGGTVGTTPIISMDENQDVVFAERAIVNGVEAADSGTTNETLEVAFTSPVDTTGTQSHNALTVDLAIGNSTAGTNTVTALQIDAITDDPQVVEKAINIGDEWDYAIDTGLPIVASAMYWFDDFIGDTVLAQYTEASGTDGQAVQTIVEEQFGVYQLTSGDAGVNTAGDGEQVSLSLEWQADQGALVFETRLHIDGAIANTELCVGLTDNVALELPFTNSADTITAVADDAVAFCYDTNATTDEWWALGVDSTTKATGNAATGTAPVADVYQTLRIEIDDGGADCRFYIDGTLAGTLTANCVTPTVALAPVVVISSAQTAASSVVDVDYILVGAARD
jgi:hypothetical protein